MSAILAIRLRGTCGVNKEIADTLDMLGLKTRYSGALLESNDIVMGMIRKIESFITWGEPSPETDAMLKDKKKVAGKKGYGYSFGLKPPVKGLRAIKICWPKGDLGYRAEAINELLKRML